MKICDSSGKNLQIFVKKICDFKYLRIYKYLIICVLKNKRVLR